MVKSQFFPEVIIDIADRTVHGITGNPAWSVNIFMISGKVRLSWKQSRRKVYSRRKPKTGRLISSDKNMRRTDREINEQEAFAILEKGEYGILSGITEEGEPYGIPLSYCVIGRNVYIHSALKGKKVDMMVVHPRVSFCVVINTELLPDEFASKYESCIVQGHAAEVSGEEKQSALEGLLLKYSRNFFTEGKRYIEKLRDETRVSAISIDTISGKARR
jgi:nitroimidazol reductase NimA-like FMN-containing flavoprotein (pyridoxamine 5'-phosphate oxidase superfamily)